MPHEIDLAPYIKALKGAKDEHNIEFVLCQLLKDYSAPTSQPVRMNRKRKIEEEPEEDEEEEEEVSEVNQLGDDVDEDEL